MSALLGVILPVLLLIGFIGFVVSERKRTAYLKYVPDYKELINGFEIMIETWQKSVYANLSTTEYHINQSTTAMNETENELMRMQKYLRRKGIMRLWPFE